MGKLSVSCFGEFRLFEDGVPLDLPPSKKARALLAYLIFSNRPQSRESLCDLFWERPNDPKGALRWALSRLRGALNDENKDRIMSDRDYVSFDLSGLDSETKKIEALAKSQTAKKPDLLLAKTKLDQVFLAGLDLPNLDHFSLWLADQRQEMNHLKGQIFKRYLTLPPQQSDDSIQLAREWLELQPFNAEAAKTLVNVLMRQNSVIEANKIKESLEVRFREAGIEFNLEKYTPPPVPIALPVAVSAGLTPEKNLLPRQKIQFCKTTNGVNLAYASVGAGPPLVKAANWLTHLELDWSAPIWSPLFRELAKDFTFIRYDERGNGLSDWDVEELSQETFVKDLEYVVDNLGLEKFPLLGISQGAAVSIEYAIRHPDRVSKLILFGGYPKGWRIEATPEIVQQREAMITLTKTGWGQNNPAYRHMFSSTFMPSASPEILAWFNDFQRQTTSPENAVKFLQAFAEIDVRHHLSKLSVPTLIIHSRGDQRIDWKVARELAAVIPNAEFVTLDSDNHLLLDGEPAAEQFLSAVREFLLD